MVQDISRMGCRIEINCRLVPGDFVMLRLPGLAPLGTRVAWASGIGAGLSFPTPLAAPVLDHLLARYPAPDD